MPSIPVDEKLVVSGPSRTPAEPSWLALIRKKGGCVKHSCSSFWPIKAILQVIIFPSDLEGGEAKAGKEERQQRAATVQWEWEIQKIKQGSLW